MASAGWIRKRREQQQENGGSLRENIYHKVSADEDLKLFSADAFWDLPAQNNRFVRVALKSYEPQCSVYIYIKLFKLEQSARGEEKWLRVCQISLTLDELICFTNLTGSAACDVLSPVDGELRRDFESTISALLDPSSHTKAKKKKMVQKPEFLQSDDTIREVGDQKPVLPNGKDFEETQDISVMVETDDEGVVDMVKAPQNPDDIWTKELKFTKTGVAQKKKTNIPAQVVAPKKF